MENDMKDDSALIVNYLLKTLGISQKELASRLGVSQAQVSKWKKGDHLSMDMEDKMADLLGLPDGEVSTTVCALTGGLEQARQWHIVVQDLANTAADNAETGYDTYPLTGNVRDLGIDLLVSHVLRTLVGAGVEIPELPEEVLKGVYRDGEEGEGDFQDLLDFPVTGMIYQWFRNLTDLYGFYVAYIDGPLQTLDNCFDLDNMDFEYRLMDLAFIKTDEARGLSKNWVKVHSETYNWFNSTLTLLKQTAHQKNVPLAVDVMNLLRNDPDDSGHEAEREALGLNSTMVHPDFYMNEMIVGMRLIHQVLPAIVEKLGITPEELGIDHDALIKG